MKYLFVLFAVSLIVSCTKKQEEPKAPQAPTPQKITKEQIPAYEGLDFSGTDLQKLSGIVSVDDLKITDTKTGTELASFPKSVFGRVEFFAVKGNYVVRPHAAIEIAYSIDKDKKVSKRVQCKTSPEKPTGEVAKFVADNGCKI